MTAAHSYCAQALSLRPNPPLFDDPFPFSVFIDDQTLEHLRCRHLRVSTHINELTR